MSGFYQSGDGNQNNGVATGFDGILDQTNFGGEFSYFRRQRLPLFGVGLVNDQSLYTNLRSSRIQGQSNFVNPGMWLLNMGADFDVTPRLRLVNNANYMMSEPPSSILRAAPKKRLGRCRALASTPPVSTLPEDGTTVL